MNDDEEYFILASKQIYNFKPFLLPQLINFSTCSKERRRYRLQGLVTVLAKIKNIAPKMLNFCLCFVQLGLCSLPYQMSPK